MYFLIFFITISCFVSWYFLTKKRLSNIPCPPKNDIQFKSLVNEIPISFIFQVFTNQFFLHETHFLMWPNNYFMILSLSFNLKPEIWNYYLCKCVTNILVFSKVHHTHCKLAVRLKMSVLLKGGTTDKKWLWFIYNCYNSKNTYLE